MARLAPIRTRLDPHTRREQILDAAEAAIRDRSLAELTFEAVADSAGVSRALVYNYFGDRRGLLAAVALRTLDQLNTSLHASIDAGLDPVSQLEPLANAYLAFAEDHGALWRSLAAGGVQHRSVAAARRIRVERLAELWGSTPAAVVAAHIVSEVLEAATIGWPGTGDVSAAVATACRILASGLEAGLQSTPTA